MTRLKAIAPLRRALAAALALSGAVAAQTMTERADGLRDNTPRWHAITGARLVVAPGHVVDIGTLVMKDGVIVAAGPDVAVPAGARVWRLDGRTVYAGFIDLAGSVGVPPPLRATSPPRPLWGLGAELPPPETPPPAARPLVARSLAARNRWVRAEQDVAQQLEWKADDAKPLRELGFMAALAVPQAGVFRGQSALVSLGAATDPKAVVIAPRVAQHLATEINQGADAAYPTSLMGAMALARQTLLDARWYLAATQASGGGERVAPNATLAALAPVLEGRQPVIYVADDEQSYQRIARVRDEFKLKVIVQGNGHEYRRAAQLKALALPVIVPLAYPPVPEVGDPDSALDTSLEALQHWEQAPSNLALIAKAGVPFAITTNGLKDAKKDFWPRLRLAVRRGLAPEKALAGLTTEPARLIGESGRLGSLEAGRIANLVVTRGDLFTSDDAEIELAFVDGRPLPTETSERADARGTWAVDEGGETLKIGGTRSAPKLEPGACDLATRGRDWVLRLPCGTPTATIVAEVQGDRLVGTVQRGDGPLQRWGAKRVARAAASAASAPPLPAAPSAAYPAGAFGIALPERPALLVVRNATLWTMGAAGRIDMGDLLVRDGRIAAVGRALTVPAGAVVIDATGKHVTPGLIDAHSHIAVDGGFNEYSDSVTSEVRIGDALDATDISIYRQLAGGLTAANLLHGSANTIGGQSQVIKLRWGSDASGLVFEGATPSIKFALGENVKRSNWGPASRYPATRMGVEQVLRDAFAAAREYARERRDWQASPKGRPEPRRDLRLESLAEILDRKRVVHIHSYRADEILMFAHLAKEYGISVAAFQHVLEGYKVADVIAAIGAGGSTFSDWWAYKMEVIDAIPANGAIMARAGVLTSFNSDNAELARRLNIEAAKAVKYGGLPETEALAFVTINPARQLGVHQRVGSLEVGKDADFVVWNGPPLSTYARAEQTWVDGRRYFDIETDRRLRAEAAAERSRLVALALKEKPAEAAPAPPPGARTNPPADWGEMRWTSVLDSARAVRHSYSNAAGWQECTEDAH